MSVDVRFLCIAASLPLKGYPAPVFHVLRCPDNSAVENQVEGEMSPTMVRCRLSLSSSLGVVCRATRVALQDRWGLNWATLLSLESGRTSHSQHYRVPCKCEVGACTDACTGVCLCTCLSGFDCCWPVRKGALKIARHQSLSWLPLLPPRPSPPTHCMYSAWFHWCLAVSVLSYKDLKYPWNLGAVCVCVCGIEWNDLDWLSCIEYRTKYNLLERSILQQVTKSRIWQSRKSSIILENFFRRGGGSWNVSLVKMK